MTIRQKKIPPLFYKIYQNKWKIQQGFSKHCNQIAIEEAFFLLISYFKIQEHITATQGTYNFFFAW